MAHLNDSLKQLFQELVEAVELPRAESIWALALGNREVKSLYQFQAEAITKFLEVDCAQSNLRYDSI